MNKRQLQTLTTIGAALLLAWHTPRAALAQADPQPSGWLEGTVMLGRQGPADDWWRVTVIDQSGDGVYTNVDPQLLGLYRFRTLKPGTYEVTLTSSKAAELGYRPQRIFGVVVRPGVRTTLNIVLEKGSTLQEVGRPVVATEAALVLSQELMKHERQLTTLQAQLDSLKRRPH